MQKLTVRSKRGRTKVQRVRLTLGADGDATLLTLQEVYSTRIGKPVSRSVIVRRALTSLLESVCNMNATQAEAEVSRITKTARV